MKRSIGSRESADSPTIPPRGVSEGGIRREDRHGLPVVAQGRDGGHEEMTMAPSARFLDEGSFSTNPRTSDLARAVPSPAQARAALACVTSGRAIGCERLPL